MCAEAAAKLRKESSVSSLLGLCLACRGRDLVMNRFNQLPARTQKGRGGWVWVTGRAFDLAWSVKQLAEENPRVCGTGSPRWGEESGAGQEHRFFFSSLLNTPPSRLFPPPKLSYGYNKIVFLTWELTKSQSSF